MDKERILIIDDAPGLRKTLSDILKVKGYFSRAARDAAKGLSLLSQGDFHVLLFPLPRILSHRPS